MRSGLNQIEQNAKEFLLDVHVVARNFTGEQDWQWLKGSQPEAFVPEGQILASTRWERFTDEMTNGARFYNNDNTLEDRIALGVCASVYCLPYLSGRVIYDGLLNSYEYGAWRLTGSPYSPLHPEGRKKNAYMIGVPLALPLIATMATAESAIRALGVSHQTEVQLTLAWRSAGYLLKRWTRQTYSYEQDFKPKLNELKMMPSSWMEGMDCIGLATSGLVLSTAVISLGVAAAGTLLIGEGLYHSTRFIGESTGRALGFSARSGAQIQLAWKIAGRLSRAWTGARVERQELNALLTTLFAPARTWMDGMDCIGLATGGLVVSTVILAGGVVVAGGFIIGQSLGLTLRFAGESLGRALGLGFSERFSAELLLSANLAGYFLKRWTGAQYDKDNDFTRPFARLSRPPTSWMDAMDCIGLATSGLLISSVIITGGALAATTLLLCEGAYRGGAFLLESSFRALGFSERATYELSLAFHLGGYLLKSWTGAAYTPAFFSDLQTAVFRKPESWMDVMDCIGLATGGLVLSTVIVATAAATAGLLLVGENLFKGLKFSVESILRAVGFSSRSANEIKLAWSSATYLLGRWTGAAYSAEDAARYRVAICEPPSSLWMGAMDCIGLATGGLVVSALIMGTAIATAGFLSVGEGFLLTASCLGTNLYQGLSFLATSSRRALGFSERSLHEIHLACLASAYLLKRWTGERFEARYFNEHTQALLSRPQSWMEGMDCIGLATGGLLISATILSIGAIAAGSLLLFEGLYKAGKFITESTVRALGFSRRTLSELTLAGQAAGWLVQHWFGGRYPLSSFIPPARLATQRPQTWMEVMDCVGLFTGGLVLSAALVCAGGALAATLLVGEGIYYTMSYLGETTRRALGFTYNLRAFTQIDLAKKIGRWMLQRWSGENHNLAESFSHAREVLFKRPRSFMDCMDCIGMFTGGLIGSAVVLSLSATIAGSFLILEGLDKGVFFTCEFIARALGFTKRVKKELTLAWNVAAFILKPWTGINFNFEYDFEQPFKAAFKKPTTLREAIDCLGLLTGGLAISSCLVAGSIAVATTLTLGEALGRALGFSRRVGSQIKVAAQMAGFLFMRWTERDYYRSVNFAPELEIMFKRPTSFMDGMSCIGLLTGGLLISTAILGACTVIATTFAICESLTVLGVALGRAVGFSERSRQELILAWKLGTALFKRWTGSAPLPGEVSAQCNRIFTRPQNFMGVMDCVGLATGGLVLSSLILSISLGCATVLATGEILGRVSGISQRSKSAMALILNLCGNAFGVASSPNLSAHRQKAFAKISSFWDVCDSLGTALSATATFAFSLALLPLAFIGFSKSNYHRYSFYKHHIANLIDERRKVPVDKTLENAHWAALEVSEATVIGKLFSKLNVFNVLVHASYAFARFGVAPFIYGIARIIKGIIPATIRSIKQALYPTNLDLADPVSRVRKRFSDLNKALSLDGHLPIPAEGDPTPFDISKAVEKVDGYSMFKRAGLSLFAEGRRLFSLGHTPEEKVVAEFENKFEQFVNATNRRAEHGNRRINVNQFFKNDLDLPNSERFSYKYMVDHITGAFPSEKDKMAIARVANLIKQDIENQLEDNPARFAP